MGSHRTVPAEQVRGAVSSWPSTGRGPLAGRPARLAPMEATLEAPRKLDGEKAQRIIAAMRASVSTRGAAASTFDHVAREAGVSRGLLHYYFGSKERLLVEVLRHDTAERNRSMGEGLAKADSPDQIGGAPVVG